MQITFDPSTVTVKEMRRLEKLSGFTDLANWFVKNCGVTEAEFDDLTLAQLQDATAELKAKVSGAMSLPKLSGGN